MERKGRRFPAGIALRLLGALAIVLSAGSAVMLSAPTAGFRSSVTSFQPSVSSSDGRPIASPASPSGEYRFVLSEILSPIPHETSYRYDPSMRKGFAKVTKAGVDGVRRVATAELLLGGLLKETLHFEDVVVKKPVTEVVWAGSSDSVALGARSAWAPVVAARYREIAPLLSPNGSFNYLTFADNGDGTITVDGRTFHVSSLSKRRITAYDAAEWYVISHGGISKFPPGTPIPEGPAFSGIPARRGIVATYAFKENGKWVATRLPMGTVVFVENYGLAVVGDIHHVTHDIDRIDLAYDPREVLDTYHLGVTSRRVYILDWP